MRSRRERDLRTSRRALTRYVAAWLLAGVVAALLVVLGVRQLDDNSAARRAVDPLDEVTASGCVLENPRGRPAGLSRPPAGGPPARASADGLYSAPQPRTRLVVVQYERRLPADQVAALRRAFSSPAPRRIVAPDSTGMAFKVAATAWGRLIGCSKFDARVVQALRRFAERYGGRGPDSAP